MSFDKVKAMRNAERFLSQGKIRAAIGEYKKIVENDPKDFSTMNILGDLYAKGNESSEAVTCFKQVADHYNKQGFAQKAIAIYNKISRLDPHSVEIAEKLAQLYQSRGSYAEARSHYTALAEQYQRKGQKNEALEIWKQIASLDPNNTEVYLKIAEFCWQNGQKEEAAKAYTDAGNRLLSLDQDESALAAFSRALEIRQYELGALNGLVKVQIKLGYADEAANRLEGILEQSPYNREILHLLVDCHIDSRNTQEAEKTVIRLVEQEPANYPKFLELVEIYLEEKDLDSAARILSMASEHLLIGGKPDDFLHWLDEILAHDPEQLESLRMLVRYYSWQRDEAELKNSLERLAQAAQHQESVADEKSALAQLVILAPHEIAFSKRLQELNYEFGNDFNQSEATEFSIENLDQSNSNANFATNYQKSFDYLAQDKDAGFGGNNHQPEVQTVNDKAFEFLANDNNLVKNNELSFETLGEFIAENDGDDQQSGFVDAVFEAEIVSEPVLPEKLKLSDELRLGQEIESVEFYVAQGYNDLAEKSLIELEQEFGKRPEFASIWEKLGVTPPPVTNEISQPKTVETPPTIVAEKVETIEPMKIESNGNSNTIDFLNEFRNELGLEELEEPTTGDYETHYHTATAYKEMGLLEDAIREFQDAFNLVRADDGTDRFFQCCNLLGHCFMDKSMPNLALMWFRRCLEVPNLRDDETQAVLYEIANAFEIGGEENKALEYFEQVYAVNVDYRDVGARLEKLQVGNLVR